MFHYENMISNSLTLNILCLQDASPAGRMILLYTRESYDSSLDAGLRGEQARLACFLFSGLRRIENTEFESVGCFTHFPIKGNQHKILNCGCGSLKDEKMAGICRTKTKLSIEQT